MKKLLILLLILALVPMSLFSCKKNEGDTTETETDTSVETEAEVWAVGKEVSCTAHHRDYHLIPYDLAVFVGSNKANAWAEEVRKDEIESVGEGECGCPEFNIKAYIDEFDISKEDFIANADMVYLGTYDTDVLYGMTPEEVAEYYIYSEALIDLTIKSQHFQFIERYFQYEYSSEMYDLIVYDEEEGIGLSPSVPQTVQALGISKAGFESILEDCTEENERVYGRSLNFDYDISLIFNEDGSYAELPEYEGLSELETIKKLNRVFCGRDR